MTKTSYDQKVHDLENELRSLFEMFNKQKRLKTLEERYTNANELSENGFFMNTINQCFQCAFCGTLVLKENVHFAKTVQKSAQTRSSRSTAATATATTSTVCELQPNCPATCPFRALDIRKQSVLTHKERLQLKLAANCLLLKQYVTLANV